ncbi:hypothetical protein [Microbacterium trichothecenolyticum]|uniref:Alkaline shock response membrane anchor protein AmaP n=1 Tax=Microbacterium trichothecenolyticum TaxID=69370 RepID=A0ABU0TW12_MICTR|nr:hypothetical protein [Microbacterium trichothecenolyticum]MDQ1123848.1 hypothetical protein [Microbacterium trichothecenolyticum]
MNATRRGLNRFVLFLVGIILLAAGALALAVGLLPAGADTWTSVMGGFQEWLVSLGRESAGWGAVAAIVVLAIILIVIAASAVRGRRQAPLQSTGSASDQGRITVTDGFASEALKNALAERDEILSSKVTAGEISKESVLHVAVTPRQNTSPREVAEHVDTLVTNLAALTGQNLRAYISIHSGLRAKLARDTTRVH